MEAESELAEPEVTEQDLVVKCPVEGCDVLMGSPLDKVNGQNEIRVRTSAENDECRLALLQNHSRGNHSPRNTADTQV
jgi:hypothetical protein